MGADKWHFLLACFVILIVLDVGNVTFSYYSSSGVLRNLCPAHVAENTKYQITTVRLSVISKPCMMHRADPPTIVTQCASGKPPSHIPEECACPNTTFSVHDSKKIDEQTNRKHFLSFDSVVGALYESSQGRQLCR